MKHNLLFLFLLPFSLIAQNTVQLNINHKVGDETILFEEEFTLPNGDKVALERCEYYVSQISITHDGGQVTPVSNVWLLVNAFEPQTFDLGEFDIQEVESIDFYIGVQSPHNNQDLTLWPSDHPLAPQNPSMHWGWSTGYRFVAIEGLSGTESAEYTCQVHALGNENYFSQNVALSASAENNVLLMELNADYAQAFNDVATSEGGITHSFSGDATDMLVNFRDHVFTGASTAGLDELSLGEVSVQIAPNPTPEGEASVLILDANSAKDYQIEITNMSGKLVQTTVVSGLTKRHNLPGVSSGIYIVQVKSEGTLQTSERWLVK